MSNEKKYRYPGTRPFETDEKNLFFGRSDDSKKLFEQVQNEKTVLLYAKSGLGKSSLINAGLTPLLAKLPFYKMIRVRFGNYNPKEEGYDKPLDKLFAQINGEVKPATAYLDKIIPNENSLWYRLKRRQRFDESLTLLFIFDQFEELLTYPEEDVFQFKKQFAHLLFSAIPPNVRNVLDRKLTKDLDFLAKEDLLHLHTALNTKVLFAIRSDRMSDLNRIADYFPNILKTFYELKPLDRQQAGEAITQPATQPGEAYVSRPFSFAPALIEKIIRSLQDEDTHTIESFQLQMLCRYAEELVVQDKTKVEGRVTEDDITDIQSIFAENYRRILDDLPEEFREAVQVLIEEKLVVAGNRVPLPELVIVQREGLPADILGKLLDSHLLRAERNSTGGRSIELSHDTLIAPVTKAFELRQGERERRKLEEEAERKGKELEAAQRQADLERARAEEQAALRAGAEKARNNASRNFRLAIGVAVVAVLLAVYAWISNQRATEASEQAKAESKRANEAKARADTALYNLQMQQALNKATELKTYGDNYKMLGQTADARENYRAALDTLAPYPRHALFSQLRKEIDSLKP